MKYFAKKAAFVLLLMSLSVFSGCGGSDDSSSTSETIEYNFVNSNEGLSIDESYYEEMDTYLNATSGALMQAIISVNNVLFTDVSVTSKSEFEQRVDDMNSALNVLAGYSEYLYYSTDIFENYYSASPAYLASSYTAKDIQRIYDSAKAGHGIRTLALELNTNAKEAYQIFQNSMQALKDGYDNDAAFYEKATLVAKSIKSGAKLSLTVGATVMTAGGATGTLALGEAAVALVEGADAVIEFTKDSAELAVGREGSMDGVTKTTLYKSIKTLSSVVTIVKGGSSKKDFFSVIGETAAEAMIGKNTIFTAFTTTSDDNPSPVVYTKEIKGVGIGSFKNPETKETITNTHLADVVKNEIAKVGDVNIVQSVKDDMEVETPTSTTDNSSNIVNIDTTGSAVIYIYHNADPSVFDHFDSSYTIDTISKDTTCEDFGFTNADYGGTMEGDGMLLNAYSNNNQTCIIGSANNGTSNVVVY